MNENKLNSTFIEKVVEYEKIIKETGQTQERLLSALEGESIWLVHFENGWTMFIWIEDKMIWNLRRGLKVEIPSIEILKDPSKLKDYLLDNSKLIGIKTIDMR